MADRETTLQNFFETTLSAQLGPNDLTATVASTGLLSGGNCILVIEPDSATQREVVWFDSAGTATTFVASSISNRYLAGSAAGSNLTHAAGSVVRMVALAQHFDDVHDRVDAITHAGLPDLSNDDHTLYSLADGSRAFSGPVAGVDAVASSDLVTKSQLDAVSASATPTGVISLFGAASPPSGWLVCQGQEISRTTYNALFAVIGTTYGAGDGSTTFLLPDLRDRIPMGANTTVALGATAGALTADTTHTHGMNAHTHGIDHTHADTFATAAAGDHAHTGPSHSHSINHDHGSFNSGNATNPTVHGSANAVGLMSYTGVDSAASGLGHSHGPGSYTADAFSVSGSSSSASDAHTHPPLTNAYEHQHSVNPPSFSGSSGAAGTGSTSTAGSHTHTITGSVTATSGAVSDAATGTTASDGDPALSILNPVIGLTYIIKT